MRLSILWDTSLLLMFITAIVLQSAHAQNVAWVRDSGFAGAFTYGTGVAVDGTANLLIVGYTTGNVDGQTLTGIHDLLIIKYDSSGTKLWTKLAGTVGNYTYGLGIATDTSQNSYVTGYVLDDTSPYDQNLILYKYASSGTRLWTELVGPGDFSGQAVATDRSDNVYVVGYTGQSLHGQPLTPLASTDALVIKYDSSGTRLWTRLAGGGGNFMAVAAATDSSENLYISGEGASGTDLFGLLPVGFSDLYVIKYDSSGTRLWTKRVGAVGGLTCARALAIDRSDNLYISGYSNRNLHGQTLTGSRDGLVIKYDSSGTRLWTRLAGESSSSIDLKAAATDSSDHLYVFGSTQNNIHGQTVSGYEDLLVIKYDSAGNRLWTTLEGAVGTTIQLFGLGGTAATDNFDNVYVAARKSPGTFGTSDAYAIKYLAPPTSAPTPAPATPAPTTPASNISNSPAPAPTTPASSICNPERAEQGACLYSAIFFANLLSILNRGTLSATSIKVAKTAAIVSYVKNEPCWGSLSGMLSPILFRLPTFDPLWPASSSHRRDGDGSTEGNEMVFFGIEDLAVSSTGVYLLLLCIGLGMYSVCFTLMALNPFNADTPPEPDAETGQCSLQHVAATLLTVVLGYAEFDFKSIWQQPGSTLDVPEVTEAAVTVAAETYDAAEFSTFEDNFNTRSVAEAARPTSVFSLGESESKPEIGSGYSNGAASFAGDGIAARRLWPLLVHLWFVVGALQFDGIVLALLHTISTNNGKQLGAGCVAVIYLVVFPSSMGLMCIFAVPRIVEARTFREQASSWYQCHSHKHQEFFYYNVQTKQAVWKQPTRYVQLGDGAEALSWEVRHGVEDIFAGLHCQNLISQFQPFIELISVLINTTMVTIDYWQGTSRAGWIMVAVKAAQAFSSSIGQPLLDDSDSQRNVVNLATAASLWFECGSMLCICYDMESSETAESSQEIVWGFLAFTFVAMVVVPVATFIDTRTTPSQVNKATEENVIIDSTLRSADSKHVSATGAKPDTSVEQIVGSGVFKLSCHK